MIDLTNFAGWFLGPWPTWHSSEIYRGKPAPAASPPPWVRAKEPEEIGQVLATPAQGWRWPIGTRVRKTRGSSWRGRVVGFYQTTLTTEGYCVESEREAGSVQLYPATALEKIDDAPEPEPREWWINQYWDGISEAYLTLEDADQRANVLVRVDCIRVREVLE